MFFFFFSSRRRHTRSLCDWSSDVCSSDLLQREAEFEADVQFREDRIERWRTELEELEQTLDRRERDIVSYVDQLQGAMANTDDAWWSRPAGGDGGVRRY